MRGCVGGVAGSCGKDSKPPSPRWALVEEQVRQKVGAVFAAKGCQRLAR